MYGPAGVTSIKRGDSQVRRRSAADPDRDALESNGTNARLVRPTSLRGSSRMARCRWPNYAGRAQFVQKRSRRGPLRATRRLERQRVGKALIYIVAADGWALWLWLVPSRSILACFFGLSVPAARETVRAISGKTGANNLQLRFIEIRLDAHSRTQISTALTTVRRHSASVIKHNAPATDVAKALSVSPTPDVVSTPVLTGAGVAGPRSDDWNAGPLDKGNAGAIGYVPVLPKGDANVMNHSPGGVTYKATRFDSSWTPDRQNAITQAIDRATFHAVVKIPIGVQLDCAGGPSSPEPLRASVAVLAVASTRCHGSSPSAPVAAKSLIDIQTMAAPSEPSNSASAPGRSANKAACAHVRVASEKLPPDCHTAAPNTTAAGESGRFLGTTPANKPPEPHVH